EVRAAAAAHLLRQAVPQPARGVGSPEHLREQRLPFRAWGAARLAVGAGVLAPLIEEPYVVVLLFQRPALPAEEGGRFVQKGRQCGGKLEIHRLSSGVADVALACRSFGRRR